MATLADKRIPDGCFQFLPTLKATLHIFWNTAHVWNENYEVSKSCLRLRCTQIHRLACLHYLQYTHLYFLLRQTPTHFETETGSTYADISLYRQFYQNTKVFVLDKQLFLFYCHSHHQVFASIPMCKRNYSHKMELYVKQGALHHTPVRQAVSNIPVKVFMVIGVFFHKVCLLPNSPPDPFCFLQCCLFLFIQKS